MKVTTLLLTFLLGATMGFAQDNLSGKYEGTVKNSDERVSLELKSEGGKVSGKLQNGEKSIDSSEGSFANGSLSLSFGKDASLTAKVEGDLIVGEWTVGTKKRSIELKRIGAPAAAAPASTASAAATPASTASAAAAPANPESAVNLSGEWEAVADANGQPFPFLLTLKVEGETVTGNSSSQLGQANVKDGSWKDGKLSFTLEGSNGNIVMFATVVDGKLSGEFDYAGQLQGKWVAVRKN